MFKIIVLFSLALMVCSCNKAGKPDSEPMSQEVSCDTSSAQIVGDKAYKNGKWWNQIDYNDKGDTIHEKWSNGSEEWYEYDAKGNLICEKWSNGVEYWYSHDYKKIAGKCRVIYKYTTRK